MYKNWSISIQYSLHSSALTFLLFFVFNVLLPSFLLCIEIVVVVLQVHHFVDFRRVRVLGGNGGDGCISLLSVYKKERAGPDGGDGGNGGHVVFKVRRKSLFSSSVSHLHIFVGFNLCVAFFVFFILFDMHFSSSFSLLSHFLFLLGLTFFFFLLICVLLFFFIFFFLFYYSALSFCFLLLFVCIFYHIFFFFFFLYLYH